MTDDRSIDQETFDRLVAEGQPERVARAKARAAAARKARRAGVAQGRERMTTDHEAAGSNPAAGTLSWWERPTVHARILTGVGMMTARVLDAFLLAYALRQVERRERWSFRTAFNLLTAVVIVAWHARVGSHRAQRMLDEFQQIRDEAEHDERRAKAVKARVG